MITALRQHAAGTPAAEQPVELTPAGLQLARQMPLAEAAVELRLAPVPLAEETCVPLRHVEQTHVVPLLVVRTQRVSAAALPISRA
jgi:hypothetical protein